MRKHSFDQLKSLATWLELNVISDPHWSILLEIIDGVTEAKMNESIYDPKENKHERGVIVGRKAVRDYVYEHIKSYGTNGTAQRPGPEE